LGQWLTAAARVSDNVIQICYRDYSETTQIRPNWRKPCFLVPTVIEGRNYEAFTISIDLFITKIPELKRAYSFGID